MIGRVGSCALLAACAHAAIERGPEGPMPPAAEVASIQQPVYTTIGLYVDDAGHITGIVPDGPAFAVDLALGDMIVSIDGKRITPARFRKLVEVAPPGTSFAIVVRRDGELQPVQRVVSAVDDQRDAGDLSLLVDRPLPDLRLDTFMDAPPLPTTGTVRIFVYPRSGDGDGDAIDKLLELTRAHAAEGLHLVAIVPNGNGAMPSTDPALEVGVEYLPIGRRSVFSYNGSEIVLVVDRDGIVRHCEPRWGETSARDVESAVLKALAQPAKPSNLPP